jgi:hypothetical protein
MRRTQGILSKRSPQSRKLLPRGFSSKLTDILIVVAFARRPLLGLDGETLLKNGQRAHLPESPHINNTKLHDRNLTTSFGK